MQLIFKRSGLRIAYTQGFNPVPKMTFTPPLPMGFGSEGELLDIVFTESYDITESLRRLQEVKLDGLEWISAEPVPMRSPAIGAILESADYAVTIDDATQSLMDAVVAQAVQTWQSSEIMNVEADGRNKLIQRDLKRTVQHFTAEKLASGYRFSLRVSLKENEYLNPVTALGLLLPLPADVFAVAARMSVQLTPTPALTA
jgi:radical SAM-linked protein